MDSRRIAHGCRCAVCDMACKWVKADPDDDAPAKFGGWYCNRCDVYTSDGIEAAEEE